MGRYYNTDSGAGGKFMFAVQPSDDPETMGMHEETPNTITYYADKDDVENITKNLNKQYDILGIPESKRHYYTKNETERESYDEYLSEFVFEDFKRCDIKKAYKKYGDKADTWCSNKGDGYTAFERKPGFCLALARIRLCLVILTDIKDEGYCSLDAEL